MSQFEDSRAERELSFLLSPSVDWRGPPTGCGGGESAFGFILSVGSNAKLVHRRTRLAQYQSPAPGQTTHGTDPHTCFLHLVCLLSSLPLTRLLQREVGGGIHVISHCFLWPWQTFKAVRGFGVPQRLPGAGGQLTGAGGQLTCGSLEGDGGSPSWGFSFVTQPPSRGSCLGPALSHGPQLVYGKGRRWNSVPNCAASSPCNDFRASCH